MLVRVSGSSERGAYTYFRDIRLLVMDLHECECAKNVPRPETSRLLAGGRQPSVHRLWKAGGKVDTYYILRCRWGLLEEGWGNPASLTLDPNFSVVSSTREMAAIRTISTDNI
jgi:hypothetical protein